MPPDFRRASSGVLVGRLLTAALPLIAALAVLGAATPSQQISPAPAPSPKASAAPSASIPRAASVIWFLDAVLNWSRGGALEGELVDDPLQVLFASQGHYLAGEIVKLAFQYARADAAALAAIHADEDQPRPAELPASADVLSHPEVIDSRRAAADAELIRLQAQIDGLQKQIAALPRRRRDQLQNLQQQLSVAQNQLALAHARAEFLASMSQFVSGTGQGGRPANTLQAQIDELERTVPQIGEGGQAPQAANAARPQAVSEPSGLSAHIRAWFAIRRKLDTIALRMRETASLHDTIKQTIGGLRQSLETIDRDARTLASQGAIEAGASPASIEARKKEFGDLLKRHKLISGVVLPLGEMSVLLTRYETNLVEWQEDARGDANAELYGVVMSAVSIAIVLGLLLSIGVVWRRLTLRYVEDVRRRSQMLQFRNVVIGILFAIVLAFEFVSEVGSLATVIGLGTAGIAVALQDVILSFAGYFRIGGRFGVKVGDWIELQGVRGEVVDIGLTKLTMMELGGEGGERDPTGRLLVVPNSVVFREKYANRAYGTSLGWDEIELSVSPDSDYRLAEKRLLEVVEEVFARYRDVARAESREMERRFNIRMEPPRPQSRLKVDNDAVRLSVRYPVDARMRNQVADDISRRLLDSLKRDPSIRLVPPKPPVLQPNPEGITVEEQPEPQPVRAPLGR
jgi:small-conductance mechanosensitive channel